MDLGLEGPLELAGENTDAAEGDHGVMRPPRSLGDVLPLTACEPDGLLVLSDGAYVRLIALEQVLQPLRGARTAS